VTGLDGYTLFLFRYSASKLRAILSIPMQRRGGAKRTFDQSYQCGQYALQIIDARGLKNKGHLLSFSPRLMYWNKGSIQPPAASYKVKPFKDQAEL
jgi:hypothetical protein